ncbi:MAG: hypothetical protein U0232_23855 [Thermomicrobiales bacterium]
MRAIVDLLVVQPLQPLLLQVRGGAGGGHIDQGALVAALGHGQLHRAAAPRLQHVGDRRGVDGMVQDELGRNRRLGGVGVVLRDEVLEDLGVGVVDVRFEQVVRVCRPSRGATR